MSNETQKTPSANTDSACTSGAKAVGACSTTVMKSDGACSTSGSKTDTMTQSKAEKFAAEIKKTWNKLTDDDVKLLESNTAHFFAKIKEKHNVDQDTAQKSLTEIKASCGSCSSEKAA